MHFRNPLFRGRVACKTTVIRIPHRLLNYFELHCNLYVFLPRVQQKSGGVSYTRPSLLEVYAHASVSVRSIDETAIRLLRRVCLFFDEPLSRLNNRNTVTVTATVLLTLDEDRVSRRHQLRSFTTQAGCHRRSFGSPLSPFHSGGVASEMRH